MTGTAVQLTERANSLKPWQKTNMLAAILPWPSATILAEKLKQSS